MDPTRFDIYLTGRLAEGLTATAASERLAQLFRSTPAAMANLVTGQPQVLKRGVDAATAQKFRDALTRAGLEVAVRNAVIAPPPQAQATESTEATATSGLSLAPIGTDVLAPKERAPAVVAEIDTSHLRLVDEAPAAAPAAGRAVFALPDEVVEKTPVAPASVQAQPAAAEPDLLTLAPADADLLRPEERTPPPAIVPDIPDLTLAEPGAVLETLHLGIEPVMPDIGNFALAPAGADLVSATEKPATVVPDPPDTSHLRLIDPGLIDQDNHSAA